jgi:hypothetical protein
MKEHLPIRRKDLQAKSRPKLKVLRDCQQATQPLQLVCFNSGLPQWQDYQLCINEKDSVINVHHCPALASKRYKTLGFLMCLNPKDLENMRGNGLVANTRLGTVS